MKRKARSRLGRSTPDKIYVRGHDLAEELIGTVSLGDFAYLELTGRLPNAHESVMFNALVVTLVEHGLTPSALAARLTYFGAPEALQGAVAAGLLGMGDRFGGSIEQAAKMLQEAKGDAEAVVEGYRSRKEVIPGIGHPIHRTGDPRTKRLFELAEEHGFAGRYVALMTAIGAEASKSTGRELPVNATGAIAAIASEMGLSWRICRGLAVMSRAIGLVAHVQEEMDEPMASEIWSRAESEAGD